MPEDMRSAGSAFSPSSTRCELGPSAGSAGTPLRKAVDDPASEPRHLHIRLTEWRRQDDKEPAGPGPSFNARPWFLP